jgi:hypothetical protein
MGISRESYTSAMGLGTPCSRIWLLHVLVYGDFEVTQRHLNRSNGITSGQHENVGRFRDGVVRAWYQYFQPQLQMNNSLILTAPS